MADTYKVGIWNQTNSNFDSTNEDLTVNVLTKAIETETNMIICIGKTDCSHCTKLFNVISNSSNTLNKFLSGQNVYLATYHSSSSSIKSKFKKLIAQAETNTGKSFNSDQFGSMFAFILYINTKQMKITIKSSAQGLTKEEVIAQLGDNPYSETTYTVTFKENALFGGTTLKTQTVMSGASASPPDSSTHIHSGYTFTGWDNSYTNITSDIICTAQYTVEVLKYTVIFKNWNNAVLKTQEVNSGESAVPPDNPVRAGYTFTGWDNSYENITANTVCTALYSLDIRKIGQKAFADCNKLEKIYFVFPVSSIGASAFINCSNLTSIGSISSVTAIGDLGFYNCNSIETIDANENVRTIGLSAFANCNKLSNIGILSNSNINSALYSVGEYAFANTGIISANLVLNSSIADTYWGDHCFEGCRKLKKVDFRKSMYQGSYMFKDCTQLTSVKFDVPETAACNYVGKYVFDGCTSLESVTFPKSQFSFMKGYFNNCTNLKTVDFSSYDDSGFSYVQKYAFANCGNLTSLVFPKSLNSINLLEDACLSGCSKLESITFNGINSSEVFENENRLTEDLYYGKYYYFYTYAGSTENIEKFDNLVGLLKEKNYPYCVLFDTYWIYDIEGCWNDPASISSFAGCNYRMGTWDQTWPDKLQYSDDYDPFLNLCKNKRAVFIRILDQVGHDEYSQDEPQNRNFTSDEIQALYMRSYEIRRALSADGDSDKDFICHICEDKLSAVAMNKTKYQRMILNAAKGIASNNFAYVEHHTGNGVNHLADDINIYQSKTCEELYEKSIRYVGSTEEESQLCLRKYTLNNSNIENTGFLRLRRNCNIQFADNTIQYIYDSTKEIQYTDIYEYPSDKTTIDNFKIASAFGYTDDEEKSVWYYNAKEIKQYADINHIPVLIMYSYESCTPCQAYLKNIHENKDFQNWAKKQKFLLCRIEADKPKAADEELRYCMEDLKDNALNYDNDGDGTVTSYNAFGDTPPSTKKLLYGWFGKTNYMPPAMTFYYKNSSNETVAYHNYSFHELISIFTNSKLGINKFKQLLKSLCLYHFDNNDLANAAYVVDAERCFYKDDYDIDVENEFQIDDYIIEPAKKYPELVTLDKVIEYIGNCQKESGHTETSGNYLGGCYFDVVDWIAQTYDIAKLYETLDDDENVNLSVPNTELNGWSIKIGDKYYKMQMTETRKRVGDTCSTDNYVYLIQWNEVSL